MMAFYDTRDTLNHGIEISSSALNWKESAPGVWARGIDECERFFRLSKRNENHSWPVTGCAYFAVEPSGAVDKEKEKVHAAFEKAWLALRYHHPSLASHVEYNEKKNEFTRIYSTIRNEQDKGTWLDRTFKMIDIQTDPLEWFNREMPNCKLPTVFLVYSSQDTGSRFTVFLQSPHDITDGVGVPHLLNQIFDYAAQAYDQGEMYVQPKWGSEGARLSPCLKVAAKIPGILSKSQNKRHEEILQKNGAVWNHPCLLGIPPSKSTDPATPRRQRMPLCISKETTAKILSACKSIGPNITVTHVFTAAVGLALSQLQPKKDVPYSARFINLAVINLRPYCHPPYDGPDHAAAAYHTISSHALGLDFEIPSSSTGAYDESQYRLSEIAKYVRDHFISIRSFTSEDMHEQVYLAPFMWNMCSPKPGQDMHAVTEPPFCDVPISSCGDLSRIVSTNYGPFHLEKVWVASEGVGAAVPLFMGTWGQELELAAVFDNRYQDVDYIRSFLERIVQIVCKGLSIDQ